MTDSTQNQGTDIVKRLNELDADMKREIDSFDADSARLTNAINEDFVAIDTGLEDLTKFLEEEVNAVTEDEIVD